MPLFALKHRPEFIVIVAFCVGVIAGCSRENIPGVYRIDIQQGNVITQEMLDQLESGMERRKVRYILGTPMLTDTFNESRWDYYYSYSQGASEPVRRRISVFFDGDKLARIEGDIRPASARRPLSARKETIVTVPPNTEGDGIFSALRPDFLGGKKKSPQVAEPTEPALETVPAMKSDEETPAASAVEDTPAVTAASASPAAVPEPSPRDEQYLQRLFQGFGRAGPGSVVGETADKSDDPEGAGTASENNSDDATVEGDGFISRLINRLRRSKNSDSTDSDPTATAEPAAPPRSTEPAAP